jgi:peroxiredoxin
VELVPAHEALTRRGGTLLAVSTDEPVEAQRMRAELGLPFPMLSDVGAVATRAFGLLHVRGGPGGKDVALPAHVLLDRDLAIRWRHVAHRIQERPHPADVLVQIERLPAR